MSNSSIKSVHDPIQKMKIIASEIGTENTKSKTMQEKEEEEVENNK